MKVARPKTLMYSSFRVLPLTCKVLEGNSRDGDSILGMCYVFIQWRTSSIADLGPLLQASPIRAQQMTNSRAQKRFCVLMCLVSCEFVE